ncbi:hypothetical protein HDF26_003949 [Pedobacter cryoconitis]|uniref:DUF4270 domain-containing protein n=1 Tax=Pedobacter cryoconitis TaxID=188932 RepID=A0A7W8ZKE3_9SPHI|nr:DUF4270 domain-containing protein [Pedobacter cryoconitis]MBB5635636.1 hypothetical protein [Pedobacter cryoconitis]MBB6273489.1 hypothetical protein [Pedobacter cryoconitis]
MKFSKLDLLTLLISLFLFSSCKDSSTIGLDVSPATRIEGILLDTVTVTSNTVLDEPAATFFSAGTSGGFAGLPRYPLGQMTDPIFGATTASLAMSVGLPSGTGFTVGQNAVIDSAVLVLPYQVTAGSTAALSLFTPFYGDSTTTFNINVSQLDANLYAQSKFMSNTVYAATTQLGALSIQPKPTTPIKVTRVITDAPDTVYNAVPQIRIKLNAAMIQSKILALDSATLSTNSNLNAAFKGLKVTATAASGKPGGIMFFEFRTGNSNLEIYYKRKSTSTTKTIDTVFASFPISLGTTATPVAATVTHDYGTTPVAAQLKTPGKYQTTYLQAMSGVRNLITFPYLKNLKASLGTKLVINKAELVIDINDPADSIPFKIPPRLSLYRLDIAKQRQNLPDNNPASQSNPSGDPRAVLPFGGYYDNTKKSYTFVVTNYIQDLIDGKTVDYGTYLAPTAATEFNVFPYPTSGGRAVIGSFINQNNRRIRLNIYYVKDPN